jgi:hypothetical protein
LQQEEQEADNGENKEGAFFHDGNIQAGEI